MKLYHNYNTSNLNLNRFYSHQKQEGQYNYTCKMYVVRAWHQRVQKLQAIAVSSSPSGVNIVNNLRNTKSTNAIMNIAIL